LDSAEGQLWVENTAYQQAEEILLDQGIINYSEYSFLL
jgi:hypothetical protein